MKRHLSEAYRGWAERPSGIRASAGGPALGLARQLLIGACAFGISALAMVGFSNAYESNTDRPGGDYRNFEIGAKLQNYTDACERACSSDLRCRAYTVVRPGFQGANARCWLKSVVTAPVPNNCCTSHVMPGRANAPPVLTCRQDIDEGHALPDIIIINEGPGAVAPGALINYRLSTGETGTVASDGMQRPGSSDLHRLQPRPAARTFTCTANVR